MICALLPHSSIEIAIGIMTVIPFFLNHQVLYVCLCIDCSILSNIMESLLWSWPGRNWEGSLQNMSLEPPPPDFHMFLHILCLRPLSPLNPRNLLHPVTIFPGNPFLQVLQASPSESAGPVSSSFNIDLASTPRTT